MKRTTFIVDGFNLYHLVREASAVLGLAGAGTKWLNLRKLCESYLPLIGGGAMLEKIYYFSALATHLEPFKPDVTTRHRTYYATLRFSSLATLISHPLSALPRRSFP